MLLAEGQKGSLAVGLSGQLGSRAAGLAGLTGLKDPSLLAAG